MKKLVYTLVTLVIAGIMAVPDANAQIKLYRSTGGELILSGAGVDYVNQPVNSNLRFTGFFHAQQRLNLDIAGFVGFFTGLGIRNVGFITEDLYQNSGFLNVDNTHPDWNKEVKVKRRSYTLGVPLAIKAGRLNKDMYLFGGAELEWTFHYKQKLFIDGEKFKYTEWLSSRTNTWLPSVFAGVSLPKGVNLTFRYYLDNFLNPEFTGVDFGEDVDYSRFNQTGIFYVSLATVVGKKK